MSENELLQRIKFLEEENQKLRQVNKLSTLLNITFKETQKELFHSKLMFRTVLDHIPYGIFWKDLESKYIGCNEYFLKEFGLNDASEIIGKTDIELPFQNRAHEFAAEDNEVILTGKPKLNYKELQYSKDGNVKWLQTSRLPLLEDSGKIIGVLGISSDITSNVKDKVERTKILTELKLLEDIINNGFSLAFIVCNDGKFSVEFVTKNIENLGYRQIDFYSGRLDLHTLIFAEDIAKLNQALNDTLSKEFIKIELRLKKSDNNIVWMDCYLNIIRNEENKIIHFQTIMNDITALKEAEFKLKVQYDEIQAQNEEIQAQNEEFYAINEELKQNYEELHSIHNELKDSEEKFRAISEQTNLGIIIIQDEKIIFGNQSLIQLLGIGNKAQLSHLQDFLNCFKKDDRQILNELFSNNQRSSEHSYRKSVQIIESNQPFWVDLWVKSILLGSREAYLVTLVDITSKIILSETLQEVNENLSVTLNSINDAIIVVNTNFRINNINSIGERLFGFGFKSLRNKNIFEVIDFVEKRDGIRKALQESLFHQSIIQVNDTIEYKTSSNVTSLNLTISPIRRDNSDVSGLVLVFKDVTEKLIYEKALKDNEFALKEKVNFFFASPLDSSQMQLGDIIDIQYLQELQDKFAMAHNVSLILVDNEGHPLTNPSNFSDFCKSVYANDIGRQKCIQTYKLCINENLPDQRPTLFQCINCGLTESSAPIVIGGKVIASWIVGQIRTSSIISENYIHNFSNILNEDFDNLKLKMAKIPVISEDKIAELADLLRLMANEISELAYYKLKHAKEILKSKEYEQTISNKEKALRTIIENTGNGIALINDKGIIIEWNKTLESITGISKNAAIGMHIWDIESKISLVFSKDVPIERLKQNILNLFTVMKNNYFNKSYTIEIITPNKQRKRIQNFVFPLESGDEHLLGIASRDITEQYDAQENLRKNQLIIQGILDSSPVAIFLLNTDGTFEKVNKAFEELFAVERNKILSKRALNFLNNPAIFDIEGVIEGEIIKTEQKIVIDNSEKFLLCVKISHVDPLDKTRKVIGTIMDITYRVKTEEKLKESEELYRQLVNTSPEAIILTDVDGKILFNSPRANELFKFSNDYALYKNKLYQYIHPDDLDEVALDFHEIWQNHSLYGKQYRFLRNDGSFFYGEVNSSLVCDHMGYPKAQICAIRDITERIQFENELIQAKNKAEESDRLKSSFLANMSHELRTPMNAILGFSSLLLDDSIETERRQEYVNIISSNSTSLMNIIDDVIDFAKIESNQLKISQEAFNLDKLMIDLKSLFEDTVYLKSNGEIKLILDESELGSNARPVGDSLRIRQVLVNLISNAIKFTEKGSIKFGFQLINNAFIKFYVKDSGIGLPKDKLDVIFERFRQVDETYTRRYGGTGLGLAISKNLVKLMGGEIWVESEIEKGSTFYFTIPYVKRSDSNDKQSEITSENIIFPDWSDKTILIAEDEYANFRYLNEVLKKSKIKIIHAENGLKAIEEANRNNIDVVLMDIKMPEMNGYNATREIKKFKPELPVIAQTAFVMEEDKIAAFEAGCSDYIAKPIKLKNLMMILSNYLK